MSTTTMNAFLTAAASDAEMAEGLAAAIGDREGNAACVAVAEYATSKGYALSAEDADAGRRAVLDALEARGALSDEQLESVTGGQGLLAGADLGYLAASAAAGTVVGPIGVVAFGVGLVNADLGMKMYAGAAEPVMDFFSKW